MSTTHPPDRLPTRRGFRLTSLLVAVGGCLAVHSVALAVVSVIMAATTAMVVAVGKALGLADDVAEGSFGSVWLGAAGITGRAAAVPTVLVSALVIVASMRWLWTRQPHRHGLLLFRSTLLGAGAGTAGVLTVLMVTLIARST